jgi:molybdenum cofactor biosynthesis protein B
MQEQPDQSASTNAHREAAAAGGIERGPIGCAILTISDTRTPATDAGGQLIRQLLECEVTPAGDPVFTILEAAIVKDEPDRIRTRLETWIGNTSIDVIITTGGTGISHRDTTIEVVNRLLTSRLDGFGELFRMVSYVEVGAAAMLSRAVAGLVARSVEAGGDTFVFSVPGSTNAVRTSMEKLIVPELPHLIWERSK